MNNGGANTPSRFNTKPAVNTMLNSKTNIQKPANNVNPPNKLNMNKVSSGNNSNVNSPMNNNPTNSNKAVDNKNIKIGVSIFSKAMGDI